VNASYQMRRHLGRFDGEKEDRNQGLVGHQTSEKQALGVIGEGKIKNVERTIEEIKKKKKNT